MDAPLAEKIVIWRHAWESDDPNSIKKQILTLVWDAGVFGIINECRRPEENGSQPLLNGPVQDFIERNFVASQIARIRKMVDSYPLLWKSGTKRDDSVFSLKSLIADIEQHRHLMSRREIFLYQGIEYDLALAKEREWESVRREIESGTAFVSMDDSAWPTSDLHQLWDRLSGCVPQERSESDIPSKGMFDRMNEDLQKLNQAKHWADVFVAHPASTASREASGKGSALTWGAIDEMTATIVRVASAISELIFQTHMAGWLATPQYDLFENMDHPWCDEKRLGELRVWWRDYAERVESWPNTEKYVEGLTCS